MTRIITFLLVVAAGASAQLVPTTNPPATAMASYNMQSAYVPNSILPTFGPWMMNRFRFITAPNKNSQYPDLSPYVGTGNAWMSYVDTSTMYSAQQSNYLYGTEAANPFITDPEGMLLHMSVDNTQAPSYVAAAQFDVYEQGWNWNSAGGGDPYASINGIFILVGSTYTDRTRISYCPDGRVGTYCNSVTLTPYAVTDRLLIGNGIPFDTVNFRVSTARVGGLVTYQYWNGTTFATLTPANDTTNGLSTIGPATLTFVPPSDWTRTVVNGSQSKYWIQVTVTQQSTSPVLSRLWGDNLLTGSLVRGWKPSACVSGHANIGNPELEYCANPAAGSTAKFRQQARVMGYGTTGNRFYLNQSNIQGGQLTVAYYLLYVLSRQLYWPGQSGVRFDNSARQPDNGVKYTDFSGYPLWQDAAMAVNTSLYSLSTSQHGSAPTFWTGMNAAYPWEKPPSYPNYMGNSMTMAWFESECSSSTVNGLNKPTADILNVCADSTWCPMGLGNNSNGVIEIDNIRATTGLYGILDGNGGSAANYHNWDMANRDPLMALAMWWMTRNPNVVFQYNTAGWVYSSIGDDYYYFAPNPATLAAPITPNLCPTCTISLNKALGASCSTWEIGCAIRIGGKDVVSVSSFSGTTLTVTSGGIVNSYPVGTAIETVKNSHQSQNSILHTPIYVWGSWFPAMGVDLGTPDATNGFNYPCNGAYVQGKPGCLWLAGTTIKGPASTCTTDNGPYGSTTNCSPLLRRDFAGGIYGSVIVLMRPATYQNAKTATTEYDTYSVPIALGGTYYPLNADGTTGVGVSSVQLRGGEAGIYVSIP
jgi:hypothetical protein